MKTYTIPHTDLVVSRIAYGCASFGWHQLERFAELTRLAAAEGFHFLTRADEARIVHTAFDQGITFFDNAAAYGFGHAEAAFGEVLKASPGLRNKMVIQTKCGICYPGQPKPGQKMGQPKQNPAQANNQGNKPGQPKPGGKNPAQQSRAPGGAARQEDLSKDIKESAAEWGAITPRVRDAAIDGASDNIIEEYRKLVEEYYRTVGDKGSGQQQ